MLPRLSPQEFVEKWRKATLKESAGAQEHFIDLCHLVGHPTPAEMDPVGKTFSFEAGATKQRGGQGWADVWKKGYFGWEYKGKHKDLDAAYQQLLQYRERRWFFPPHDGQRSASLRLGMATKSPLVPSISLRSRTTNSPSSVIVQ